MRFFYTIVGFVARGVPFYIIGPIQTERTIIEDAQLACARGGATLEEIAGIDWVTVRTMGEQDIKVPVRDFCKGELLSAALKKLNEKTKIFEIFDCDNPLDTHRFIESAASLGLGAEACRLALTVESDARRRWTYGAY